MEKEKSRAQQLADELLYQAPDVFEARPELKEPAWAFCEGYRHFLNRAKTEREFVAGAVSLLQAAGYTLYEPGRTYRPGDKVYCVNRGKALLASTFGTLPVSEGVRINAAHIDSPRLDLKQNPLYEKGNLSYFKTHYYGGLRKYQWTAIRSRCTGSLCAATARRCPFASVKKRGIPYSPSATCCRISPKSKTGARWRTG